MCTAPAFPYWIHLILQLISLLESLYSPGGIQHTTFTGKKRVTVAAYLDLQLLFCRACFKGVTAGANYLGIVKILGMNFIFHIT